ncbi:MAG: hypothetical protein WCS92_01930 [Candidatus Babeliales bacterium]|jgi:hypothetical protein
MYCQYYQATVNTPCTHFITGILRSHEHLVFERALDGRNSSIIEFFVPQDSEAMFVDIMHHFVELGYVFSFGKKENRLKL